MCFHNRFTLYWLALNDLLALPADSSTVRKGIGQASWWVNETPPEAGEGGVPALYLFILNIPDSQPGLWCRGKEKEIGSGGVMFPFFSPSLFCGAEFTANTPVPGAPWAAGDGEGGGRREMNGERDFLHWTPQNRESVHSCQALPVSRFTLHFTSSQIHCFLWSQWWSCQAIHQQWSLANRTERDGTSAVPTAAPPPLCFRGIAAPNLSSLALLSSPIWITSTCQQCFPSNPAAWTAASTQYGSHSCNS